jgi:hypothetical protein
MKKLLASAILGAGLTAGLSGTALAQQGVSDTEIVFGSNGDMSGPFASFNVQAIEAAQMMFDEVNAAGGIHGRKIKFVVEDHGYQMPKAQQNFNKLVNSDKVFAMLLNLGTPMNIAGFKLMEPKKIANISPLTAARQMIEGDITYKYTGTSSYYDQLRAGVEYLAKETGAKEVCAMYFPTDFGLEVYEGAKDEAAKLGLTFAAETQHKADEQDFVGSVTKLREAGCDIVATAVSVRQTITILGHLRRDEAAEQQVGDRRQEQRRDRRQPQPADDHPAQRDARLGAGAARQHQRQPPSTVQIMVIVTGRSRMLAALSIASRTPRPRSRNWLANSTIRMPFLAMTPTSSTRPIWL